MAKVKKTRVSQTVSVKTGADVSRLVEELFRKGSLERTQVDYMLSVFLRLCCEVMAQLPAEVRPMRLMEIQQIMFDVLKAERSED